MISTYSDSINSPFKSFARGASLSAVLIGLFSIVIWLINSDLFYYLLRVSGIVQIDTSFCFILAGTSLFLLNIYPSRRNRNISTACTIVLLAIAAFSICGYLKISDIMCRHIYCFHSKIAPETAIMAPATSMYFLLLGFTFIFLNSRLLTFSAQALSLIGISIGILNLMGHTYGIPALLSIGNYPQTDLLSTMLFLLLMFASLLSHPDKHIVSVITSPYIGGVISRKLLPIALSVPFFLGWLRLMGQKAGFYGLETGIAITGLSSILVFTIIIWGLSNSLNSIDSDRNKAEDISRETNEKLLRMIEDLEEDKKKNALIAEMKDLLQTCTSIPETAPVIKKFVEQLLPSHHGALFLLSPSRNDLEPLVHWGDLEHNPRELIFSPEECWALRRGRPYLMKNPAEEIICPHVKAVPPPLYFCIPLTAYGEVLGLFHLRSTQQPKPSEKTLENISTQKTAEAIAEHLAISLSTLKLREKLKNQSIRDPLTGLFNRRYMEETLQREVFRAARQGTSIGIIMADIDHFKNFNDAYGHRAGDDLLIQLGKFFLTSIRASDVACRYGGEEFTVFIPDAPSEDVYKRAEDLRTGVKNLNVLSQGKLLTNITISLGIAIYPKHGTSPENLLKAADNALYRAKKEGRDRVIMEE